LLTCAPADARASLRLSLAQNLCDSMTMLSTTRLALFPSLILLSLCACSSGEPQTNSAPAGAIASKSAGEAKPAAPVAPVKPAAEAPAAPKPVDKPDASTAKPADPMPKKTDALVSAPAAAAAVDGPPVDAAIATMRAFIATQKYDKTNKNWKTAVKQPPKLTFDAKTQYFWLLDTSEGPIKIRLMPDVAPMHVSSTIYLTEIGFYDDLKFHRVIAGFMAQGGDPLGTGGGGPAYKYAGEFSPTVKHTKPGMLSMANAGPNTDGSQFFLTFVPTPHLDGKHTIFGEVVEGLDNLKKLESFGSSSGDTTKPLKITSAKILVQ
jgi:peptidyl-prolyl cis-trans isomerase B (cyclophilin B)